MEPTTLDTSLLHAALTRWLIGQRWFAGKGRPVAAVEVATSGLLVEDPPVRIEAVTVVYADGHGETYQVPVSYREESDPALAHVLIGHGIPAGLDRAYFAYDALHDPAAAPAWLAGMSGGRHEAGLSFHREPSAAKLPTDAPSRVLAGEQSNTSVVFGDAVILKVFRRLVPGANPEVELLHALAQAENSCVAPLLGWVDGNWRGVDGREHGGTLAIATEFLQAATGGWDLALASVRALLVEADADPGAAGGDFAAESFRLGQATAAVHTGLARVLGSSELSGAELKALVADLTTRLDEAVTAAPPLQPFAREIAARYAELAAMTRPLPVQRIHGDLHLGQAMRVTSGWRILDFEGEPGRPARERAAPLSPLKDVAGMLRSFDYAGRQLLTGSDGARPGAEERVAAWAEHNQRAYCAGYADIGGLVIDDPAVHVPLNSFILDKAVYEVVYETRNRPDWVDVPLGAIRRLLEAGAAESRS